MHLDKSQIAKLLPHREPMLLIDELKDIKKLIANNIIFGGMIPKVNTCINAVKKGVKASVIIDGKVKHALLKELFSSKGVGTLFRK